MDGDQVEVDDEYVEELDSVLVEPLDEPGLGNRYVAKVKLSSVPENYLNPPYNINLGIKFIPEIDTVTYNNWSNAFGDYSVTDKLLIIIDSEVSS